MEDLNRYETLGSLCVLPVELIIEIFKYLTVDDLLCVRKTSKGFRAISGVDAIWIKCCEKYGFNSFKDVQCKGPEILPSLGPYALYFLETMRITHKNWVKWKPKEKTLTIKTIDIKDASDGRYFIQLRSTDLLVYDLRPQSSSDPLRVELPIGSESPAAVSISGSSIFVYAKSGVMIFTLKKNSFVLHGPWIIENDALVKSADSVGMPKYLSCDFLWCTKNFVYIACNDTEKLKVHVLCLRTCRPLGFVTLDLGHVYLDNPFSLFCYSSGSLQEVNGKFVRRINISEKPSFVTSNVDGVVATYTYFKHNFRSCFNVFFHGKKLWTYEFCDTNGSVETIQPISPSSLAFLIWDSKKYLVIVIEENGQSMRNFPCVNIPCMKLALIPNSSAWWGFVLSLFSGAVWFKATCYKHSTRGRMVEPPSSVPLDDIIYIDHNIILSRLKGSIDISVLYFQHDDDT